MISITLIFALIAIAIWQWVAALEDCFASRERRANWKFGYGIAAYLIALGIHLAGVTW